MKEIKGITLSKGYAKGKAQYISDALDYKEASKIFKKGNILVTHILFPEFNPVFYKAKAVVCAVSSITSHPAIISRELGIPCIGGINTKQLLKEINNLDEIIVDANNSKISFKSRINIKKEKNQSLTKIKVPKSKEFNKDKKEIIFLISKLDYKNLDLKLKEVIKFMRNNYKEYLKNNNKDKLNLSKSYFFNLTGLLQDKFIIILKKNNYTHDYLLNVFSKVDQGKVPVTKLEKTYKLVRKYIQKHDGNGTVNKIPIWEN
jgi:phosphohistidine swiveling domain-containing protein